MPDLVRISRALLSVADKTDLVPFARALVSRGVSIISTGGTARALEAAGVPVTPVERVTGFPEIMDGRVKTLHPAVHGALLALRDNQAHADAMTLHGIRPIDLVCINLYPFERTIADPGAGEREAIEQIDIGGPSMLRSAAKNFHWVTVVTSPTRYDRVISELDAHDACTSLTLRAELAAAAFGRTAEYDAAIAAYLSRRAGPAFPQVLRLGYVKVDELRYGENPHQEAALYRDPASTGPTIVGADQLHGKRLSYNNIADASAALELTKALRAQAGGVAAAVIKHTNPCGCAVASSARAALDLALAGDPVACFGGILALGDDLDDACADRLMDERVFLEVIAARSFTPSALDRLRARWSGVRLLSVGDRPGSTARKLEYRSVPGGMLVQDRNVRAAEPAQWTHRAGPAPTPDLLRHAACLEAMVKFVSSNAIVIGGPQDADAPNSACALFGVGAGQMDRVTACRIAVEKAGGRARGAIAVGDAFFPFDDGPKVLIGAGVRMIVHPGGSRRDDETFKACADAGVACMTTGVRHFRH